MQNSNLKTNTILLIVLIILVLGLGFVLMNKNSDKYESSGETLQEGEDEGAIVKDTYTYTNHGFSIELPKGFVPKQEQQHSGPGLVISLPVATLVYLTDSNIDFWQTSMKEYTYVQDKKIGETTFKVYTYSGGTFYWYQKGKVAYEFSISTDKKGELETLLQNFKFVGWPQVEGSKEDLVSFSIKPGQEVSGEMTVTGVLKGAYFFEGSFPITILDANKKSIPFGGYATATTDWMTAGPVSFTTYLDFNKMPKGNHYIGLLQDDPSGGESGKPIRKVFIPIVIK